MISSVWSGVDFRVSQPFLPVGHVHAGIDIACPTGTIIKAARAGVVERVQQGMTSVRVGSQRDFYLHGTSLVKVGQAVAKDQPVIRSGMVAVDPRYPPTGPHLHFEVQNGYSLPAAPPGAWEDPSDPVPVLLGLYGSGGGQLTMEDEMLFTGPVHPKTASIVAFAPGNVYRAPVHDDRLKGAAIAKGASVAVDGYVYSSSGFTSTDLSAAAGSQTGQDFVWWHTTSGYWVPDAILNTSKMAGAPGAAIPATEPLDLYFAARGAAAPSTPVDTSSFATHDEVKKAVADGVASVPGKIAAKLMEVGP